MLKQNWVTNGYNPISKRCLYPNQVANKTICGSQQYRFYLLVNVRKRARKKDKRGEGGRGGGRERGRHQTEDSHHCGYSGILFVLLHSF